MGVRTFKWILLLLLQFSILLISQSYAVRGINFDYPSANLSTTWTNNPSIVNEVSFGDGSMVRSLLLRGSSGPCFASGFFCKGTCDSFLFAIFIVQTNSGSEIVFSSLGFPQVVWSANRDYPVRENSTLELTQDGDLVLRDFDGTKVWSTNTSGKSVTGMNITESGNLVLFDRSDRVVWQSFDHPTDSLVLGQRLVEGQRITASVSASNSTQGLLYFSVSANGLAAFVKSDPPQMYYQSLVFEIRHSKKQSYARFINGSLAIYILSAEPSEPDDRIEIPQASSIQYVKLESDGHLRVYEWQYGWKVVGDLLTSFMDDCAYPTVCGNYGICSNDQCICPRGINGDDRYFRQLNWRQPNLGCYQIDPISCETREYHYLLDIGEVSSFNYIDVKGIAMRSTDAETCKQACLKNCSCKAALFQYGPNVSDGDSDGVCFLPSQIFSLMENKKEVTYYNSSAFIKVQAFQIAPSSETMATQPGLKFVPATSRRGVQKLIMILSGIFGTMFIVFLMILLWFKVLRKKDAWEEGDDYIEAVKGLPSIFSYEELRVATENFSKMLGKGGFGSVFEGNLRDGMKVAVKRLDSIGQGKKEFLAEVETIGSIHHLNLVRLAGFCAEKSHRLLVYEYMSNGSLDNWIFYKNQTRGLNWETKKKIVLDIAKGLSYLHEECRQRIVHLDIKPQNILLDDSFNAKVSDFGLSKLIDRDKSQVITTMRGTPGYLAPEWLSSKITEKVDVYSFGIVVLEIVCGRKNLDYSEPEEKMHLLQLLQSKVEQDQLMDMFDKRSEDMQFHIEEAMKMIRIAMWCLQRDFSRRPSMSVVVKVLEGVIPLETTLDYEFLTSSLTKVELGISAAPLASILSGPR